MRHVTVLAKVFTDSTGVQTEIPVILTDEGPLQPLMVFLLERSHARSYAWMQKLIQIVGLLLDYMAANHRHFDDPKELFTSFVQRLYSGTIGENGLDPSGLYWLPRSSRVVSQMANQLSEFSNWMATRFGTKPLNPWRQATQFEEMLNWAAYHQKHNRAFLGHTWDGIRASTAAKLAKNTLLKRSPIIDHQGVKHFPDERIYDLLFQGFIVPGKQASQRIEERLNLRDILITLLMHFGGVRVSEPFHLYVHDVSFDPHQADKAVVRIYHPSEGLAPDDWKKSGGRKTRGNRATYLQGKYGMRPRNHYYPSDQLHAGWKGGLLDSRDYFMYIHWFPTWAGKLFLTLWNHYLIQRALKNCRHPFAFVTEEGAPYSPDSFARAHARAIERIGLVPAKMLGTTAHGHRHAYGQRLVTANIDPIFRKKALHHKSMESQLVYTEPQISKVTETLEKATQNLNEGKDLPTADHLCTGLADLDLSAPLWNFNRSKKY